MRSIGTACEPLFFDEVAPASAGALLDHDRTGAQVDPGCRQPSTDLRVVDREQPRPAVVPDSAHHRHRTLGTALHGGPDTPLLVISPIACPATFLTLNTATALSEHHIG